jgi:chaperonin GroEL (HSP60 family)
MESKLVSEDSPMLSEVIIDGAKLVAEGDNGSLKVDLDNIKVEKKSRRCNKWYQTDKRHCIR